MTFYDFPNWLKELKKLADENQSFHKKLNKKLYLQFYAPNGVALIPSYHFIDLENRFQNMVGRGHYEIDRQLILDANYRVGGKLPDLLTASITLPGNVVMGDQGYPELLTLTHEAHHLMQQHQSGVFGFYLFRYLPTAFKTGYEGHPDERMLDEFTGIII